MSQAGSVIGLAVRELWISFRLLGLLVLGVGAGAGVALFPASVADTLERLALGLAVAVAAAAAVAAWSVATERTSGRAGWLVGRSVGRGTLVAAWFLAVTAIAVAGIAIAAGLGWLALAAYPTRPDPGTYLALVAGVSAWAAAAIAAGILAGTLLPRLVAALVAAALAAGIGLLGWLTGIDPATTVPLPGISLALLAGAADHQVIVGPAVRGAGVALAAAAALLIVARAALERADL